MANIPALRITARRDGFRRAGIEHGASPVDHPLASLSKAQIAQLKAEPALVVVEVEIDDPDAAEPAKPAATRGGAKTETKSEPKA